jgi:hypothetical protein
LLLKQSQLHAQNKANIAGSSKCASKGQSWTDLIVFSKLGPKFKAQRLDLFLQGHSVDRQVAPPLSTARCSEVLAQCHDCMLWQSLKPGTVLVQSRTVRHWLHQESKFCVTCLCCLRGHIVVRIHMVSFLSPEDHWHDVERKHMMNAVRRSFPFLWSLCQVFFLVLC